MVYRALLVVIFIIGVFAPILMLSWISMAYGFEVTTEMDRVGLTIVFTSIIFAWACLISFILHKVEEFIK